MSAPTARTRQRKASLGSWMSTKQMAQTVKDGRAVTLEFAEGQTLHGYLAGMDDYYWLVVDPDTAGITLVRKGAVGAVVFDAEAGYLSAPAYSKIEPIIRPFREAVLVTLFGRGGSASTEKEA